MCESKSNPDSRLVLAGFGFGFKKIEVDSDSSGFGSKFGFEMSGFAHHCSQGMRFKVLEKFAMLNL